jgi:endonuclease YncB( thermonuclease family)
MSEVVDGGTIKLTTGETIWLSGINAPEKNECFGSESRKTAFG